VAKALTKAQQIVALDAQVADLQARLTLSLDQLLVSKRDAEMWLQQVQTLRATVTQLRKDKR